MSDSLEPRIAPKMLARGLHASYGSKEALRNVNFSLVDKRVTAIIGPSECGKSTFVRCLNRTHELSEGAAVGGEVLLNGNNIYDRSVDPVSLRRRVGLIAKRPNVFPTMTVRENVLSGLRLNGIRPTDADEVVEHCLTRVLLWNETKDNLDQPALSLPVGDQQRVCIARMLALEPDVVLMDEPCAFLDPVATAKIEDLLRDLSETCAVLVVTHSVHQAARVSDFAAFFLLGALVEYSDTDTLFTKPRDARTEDYLTGRFG